MAGIFDDAPSASTLTATQRAFLNGIAGGESGGRYDVIYGGGKFEDFSDHPRKAVPIQSGPNVGKTSSAAGKYQFLGTTWDEAKNALGLPDFSPASQDKAAAWLADRDYKKKTGRDLWSDVEAAAGDPSKLNAIGANLSGTWTSLPGGIEKNSATAAFGQRAAGGGLFDDAPAARGGAPVAIGEDGRVRPKIVVGSPSPMEAALSPITSYPETYMGMVKESQHQMSRGVDQLRTAADGSDIMGYPVPAGERAANVAYGAGNAALGAMGYVGAPINAALRTVVGKPIEDITSGVVPKELTEFATSLMIPGIGMTRLGARPPTALPPRPVPTARDEVIAAAQRQGVDLPVAVASDSPSVQQAGKIATNIPIAGQPLRGASQRAIDQLDDAATNTQAAYGQGSVPIAGASTRRGIDAALQPGAQASHDAGLALQGGAQTRDIWRSMPMKARVDALYARVDDLVNPTTIAPITNTRNIANQIAARRVNAGRGSSGHVEELQEALSRPGMNYEGIKDLRQYYGEMIKDPRNIPHGMSNEEVKQIYGALSSDMRIVIARAGGPEGLRAYDRAERVFKRWAEIRKDLSGLTKGSSDEEIFGTIAAAAGSTTRADEQLLRRVRASVGPENWGEVSSAVISRMGRDADGNFSPDRFLTAYGKLSETGRNTLFRSAGHASHAEALDDIATISRKFKQLNQYANPSGTGQTVVGTGFVTGAWAEPVTAVTTFLTAGGVATVLSRPATSRSMAAWSRAYHRAVTQNTPGAVQGYENASKIFAASVGTELSRSDVVPSLTKQLQSLAPARAEQETVDTERSR